MAVPVATWAVAACALALVGLVYLRLFFGIDFTDESFYAAVPYRFVLGAKPYIDEVSVTDTNTAILLYPLVWLYVHVAGRTGIVLYLRQLHFLVSLGLAAVTLASLRRLVGTTAALLVAALALVFTPFDIPSVGYDGMTCALFTAGCLLGFHARSEPRARLWAGICLGLAAFAYPPLCIAVLAACLIRLRGAGTQRGAELRSLVAPALLLPALGFAALGTAFGAGRVVDDFKQSARFLGEAGGAGKLRKIGLHEWTTFPYWYLVLAALLVLALTWRRWPRLAAAVLVLLPLLFVPPHLGSYSASLDDVAHFGWLALPLLLPLRRDPDLRRLFLLVWVPALIAGLVTAYSSANGGVNFGVGFFPAALVAAVFCIRGFGQLVPERPSLALAPAAVVAAVFVFFSLVPVYRDSALLRLDARVATGPYAGLLTSPLKRDFLDRLQADLGSPGPSCRITFLRDFPAGYLLTDATIDTNLVWTAAVPVRDEDAYARGLLAYYRSHGLPNVVVLTRRVPYALPGMGRPEAYRRGDPLLSFLRTDGYRNTVNRFDYSIYRRGVCGSPATAVALHS